MNTTYRLVMSNGERYQRSAQNAGEAMYAALQAHPGNTVARCHSGLTEEEAEDIRKSGKKGVISGIIEYDIPPHRAVAAPKEEAITD